MIDQSLVQSGFDAEILLGERYLRYFLLSSVETGTLPMRFSIEEPPLVVALHPPQDYERLPGYDPNPDAEPFRRPVSDAFETEILFDRDDGANLRVRMRIDLERLDTGESLPEQFVDLFIRLAAESQGNGSEPIAGARLRLEVLNVEVDAFLSIALEQAGQTPEILLPIIKERVDREVDLGVGRAGQNLQAVALRIHESEENHPAALGVYLNLRLRDGPEPDAFLGERGNLEEARNFLPNEADLAFGMPGSLYGKLGADAKFRMAVERSPGSGDFHFPIREKQSDPCSEQKGKIKNITVEPLLGNRLRIDVHGEFFADLVDPDFHLTFDINPRIEDGVLDLSDIEDDIDVELLGEFLVFLGLAAVVVGLGATSLAALIILAAQELVVEPIAAARTGDAGDSFDASFFDALPHRLAVERRRWDPLYATAHQVVALLDGIQINRGGIGFSGRAILGKQPEPVDHVVLRDEARSEDGEITALRYRVRDAADFEDDFSLTFPGTDRRPVVRIAGDAESNLYELSLTQVRDRLASDRLRRRITYAPKKANVRAGQIRRLLCISDTEAGEERARLLEGFRRDTRDELLAEQGDELREEVTEQLEEELGQTPTEAQVEAALEARIDVLVAIEEATFVCETLPDLLESAIEPRLRFDLDSPEFLALEDDDVLAIRGGYQRITMERDGRVSRYYRDPPDGDPADNLLSLPRYSAADRGA